MLVAPSRTSQALEAGNPTPSVLALIGVQPFVPGPLRSQEPLEAWRVALAAFGVLGAPQPVAGRIETGAPMHLPAHASRAPAPLWFLPRPKIPRPSQGPPASASDRAKRPSRPLTLIQTPQDPYEPIRPPMPLRHPEALAQYRTCPDCGRSLLLSSEYFALRKGPGRYPWQPSAYAIRCKLCQPAHLAALRAATKAARYAKETERQRERRTTYKASNGFGRWPTDAERAAAAVKKTDELERAAIKAETRRILRAGRPYDEGKDPIKRMIRARQAHYQAKRAGGPETPAPTAVHVAAGEVELDYMHQLEVIRNRHLQEVKDRAPSQDDERIDDSV